MAIKYALVAATPGALSDVEADVAALPVLASGTYTPTLNGAVNITSFTASPCQWMRVGNVVTVSGKLDVATTLASGTFSALSVSLPVPSIFVDAEQCGGTAHTVTAAPEQHGGFIAAVTGTAFLEWLATHTANASWSFTFTYQIL
jgi:hypothetical protein